MPPSIARSAWPLLPIALLAACTPVDPQPEAPTPPPAQSQANYATTIAEGGRPLTATEIRGALQNHECSGENAAGLFEISFATPGAAQFTSPSGLVEAVVWRVDEAGALCSPLTEGFGCSRIVALEDTMRLFGRDGDYEASLVCTLPVPGA